MNVTYAGYVYVLTCFNVPCIVSLVYCHLAIAYCPMKHTHTLWLLLYYETKKCGNPIR